MTIKITDVEADEVLIHWSGPRSFTVTTTNQNSHDCTSFDVQSDSQEELADWLRLFKAATMAACVLDDDYAPPPAPPQTTIRFRNRSLKTNVTVRPTTFIELRELFAAVLEIPYYATCSVGGEPAWDARFVNPYTDLEVIFT